MDGLAFSNQIALPLEQILRQLPTISMTSDEIRRGNLVQIMVGGLLTRYSTEDLKEFVSKYSLLNGAPAIDLAAQYPDLTREALADFRRMIQLTKEN